MSKDSSQVKQNDKSMLKTKIEASSILKKFAKDKPIYQVSKTIVKIHKEHNFIKRYREFNEQNSIEPYEGLREILDKKSIDGVLKDIKNRLKQKKKE